jgi:putative effector of murein hydrolase LrgA (UPF0299 family)
MIINENIRLLIGSLILIAGFIISMFIAYRFPIPIGIGFMGLVILLAVLIGANILSEESNLTTGEIRRSIAISFISTFYGLLAFGDKIKIEKGSILEPIFENFQWIIITIIGFYFGGRSAEEIVKLIMEKRIKKLESKEKNNKVDQKDEN